MARFSETLMDHFQSPRNRGRMEPADAVGIAGVPGQGRHLILYVRVEGERIGQAQFDCHGCGVTIACGSALTELIIGRTPPECAALSVDDLVDALDGVPSDKRDCPGFAIHALRAALAQIAFPAVPPPSVTENFPHGPSNAQTPSA